MEACVKAFMVRLTTLKFFCNNIVLFIVYVLHFRYNF
jgi:hypothetical protein